MDKVQLLSFLAEFSAHSILSLKVDFFLVDKLYYLLFVVRLHLFINRNN